MHKLKRLRRREAPVDVHSEDEEEFDVTRGVLEFSDISDSEASCEDSDVESEASHSEGEEEMQEETNIIKEEATNTREELSLTREDTNSIHRDASSLVEDTITASSKDISEIITMSKEVEQPISTSKQKLSVEGQPEIKHEENNSVIAIKDSEVEDGVSLTDGDELQSHSGNENEAQDEKQDDFQNSVSVPEMSGWQKKVLARQEYRKKLAEDPAFVPHLGEFWGHDDRFIKDELRDDFDSHYRKSPSFASRGKSVWGNSPRERWDHDGFEELMKIEDEEKRRKEFQRRIQHRREFVPPAPRRRSHNITPPKFNHSRPSNSIRKRRNSFEEQSRSREMFLSKYDKNNKGENINSNDFNHHKSSVRGSRSENSYNGNSRNVTSTSRFNDNKPFAGRGNSFPPRGGNGFRGRGYSSRHYMRSNLNRDHSSNSNQADVSEMDGKHNSSQDKNSKEQHLNSDDVDNKDSHVTRNAGQQESRKNEVEENINTVSENQIEKAEPAQEQTDVTSHVNITSSSFTKEGTESGSQQESVYEKSDEKSDEKSNEESGVETILDSQSKKATEDNDVAHSISQSINNVTSSFNELSVNNNNQSDTMASLSSTLTDKDRVQTSQASKRYSTRRAASFSITQPIQTNDPPVSGIPNNPRTSEIPPSAVFAPPFQPRAHALSDESSISNEDSPNNFFPQKPETPIAYYVDNLPQGLRNNLLSENNLPQPTSIPPAPYVTENNPYGTESNGMVYYYNPNMYYYFYPTHTTPELKDTNDNSVKSSSFISQSPTTVQDNDGVYYYYPVYYQ